MSFSIVMARLAGRKLFLMKTYHVATLTHSLSVVENARHKISMRLRKA